jgi:hypothetical protein
MLLLSAGTALAAPEPCQEQIASKKWKVVT